MNKIISLIKVDFNNTFGLSSLIYNFKKKKNRWTSIIFILAFMSLIPSYILMLKPLAGIYGGYEELGQRSYFLQLGIFTSQLLIFILGILYVMSKYYFSNDLNTLVPLPIKASHILSSKFATLMISEYLTSLPIVLPFIIIYGLRGNEGILYWIYSLLIILFIPVIPLIISSIVVMLFMKYTNIKGKKDTIRIIASVIFIVAMIYIQMNMQNFMRRSLMEGGDFFLKLASDSNVLVKKLGIIFPPSVWATLSLANYKSLTGVFYLLLTIGVSIAGFILMIVLSEKLFFQGLIGNIEVSTSRKGSRRKIKLGDRVRTSPAYMAIARKELIMIYKTPVYLINSIGGVIMVPIIFLISFSTGDDSFNFIFQYIANFQSIIVLGAVAMISSLGILNSLGSTTFSREGKNFWIQRVLPIRVEDQIIGRVLSSLAVQVLGIVSILIALLILVRISIQSILIIVILGLLGSIATTEIGMIIDILRPLLTWDNPQRAMKQNLNVLISMGLGMIYILGLGYMTVKLLDRLDIVYIYLLLAFSFILTSLIFYRILKRLIKKQFEELE